MCSEFLLFMRLYVHDGKLESILKWLSVFICDPLLLSVVINHATQHHTVNHQLSLCCLDNLSNFDYSILIMPLSEFILSFSFAIRRSLSNLFSSRASFSMYRTVVFSSL